MRAIHKPKQAISNIRGTPSAYDTATRFEDGSWQTYVVTHCIECGEEFNIHWNTGGADPRFVDKKMRGLGWHFDAFKPKNCVCPACVTGRRGPAHPDSDEDDNLTPREEPMVKANSVDNSGYQPPQRGDTAMLTVAGRGVQNTEVPRKLTAHEKQKIRQFLDGHFDEARGRYLDEYNDKKIGEEVNVPWALVTELRELAYGPLKDDPEVVAYKAEAAAIRQEFIAFKAATATALEEMHATAQKLEGRLLNLEGRAKRL